MKYNPYSGSQKVCPKEWKRISAAIEKGQAITNPEADKTNAAIIARCLAKKDA
jgi:hypothetical protein